MNVTARNGNCWRQVCRWHYRIGRYGQRMFPRWESWFLLVRDASGRACAGVAIEVVRTRAMPGYAVLRVEKLGGTLPGEVSSVALEAIAKLARSTPRVLRLQLNVFSRDGRETIGKTLEELGFREVRPPSSYRHTLVIDLKPSEDEIFASLGKSARRRIRETVKLSLRSVVITDPLYAERLKELQLEALQRTGGHSPSEDWRGILRMSQEHPDHSRVIGVFPGEDNASENMGAFGWVCNQRRSRGVSSVGLDEAKRPGTVRLSAGMGDDSMGQNDRGGMVRYGGCDAGRRR